MMNYTKTNSTSSFCIPFSVESNGDPKLDIFLFVPLYILVIVVSLLGNMMLIVVVYRRTVMQTFTNILICNCATTDLIITLFSAVLSVVDTLKTKGKWYIGTFMCSFVHFFVIASVAANIVTLLVIALDRLLAVTSPYKKILKNKLLVGIIPGVWMVAFGFASPTIYTQSVIYIDDYGPVCVEMWLPPFKPYESPKYYTIVLFVFLYALPLTVMIVIYGVITKELVYDAQIKIRLHYQKALRRTKMKLENVDGDLDGYHIASALVAGFKKRRVVCMLIIMIVAFAICWLPVYVLQFLTSFHPYYSNCHEAIPNWAYALAYLMQYGNSAVDPLLYFWFSGSYRRELRSFSQVLFRIHIRYKIRW